jgi:sugar lactone lactonase YvrE
MIRVPLILIFTCVCIQLHAQVNIITTIAGTGNAAFNGDGGPAITAEFNRPYSICLDNLNNLFLCDGFNHRIRKISLSTGIVSTVAGKATNGFSGDGGAATDAELLVPQGIQIDTHGNLYISDGGNHRIRKVDASTHNITTIVGNGTAGMSGDGNLAINASINGPAGLAIYEDTYLYISDYLNKRVRRVDLNTGIIITVAGNGTNGYSGNNGLATNAQLNGAIDVTCDNVGNIYIADTWNGAVRKVDISSGIITTFAGTGTLGYAGDNGPATNAQLNELVGLFFDKLNNLLISDYRNGAIRRVDAATGIITTVAGGIAGYGGDGGPATNAKLKCTDVWMDDYGNIYIADYVNNRIRKVNNAVAVNGIDKLTESKLYPNPTKGVFFIQTPIGISLVNIYNVAGLRVYERTCTTTETEIDVTSLPSGVYMVYVQCGDKQYVSKVVKY